MILVDTSVWIDHLRANNVQLVALIKAKQVLTHPFVVGELAMGSWGQLATVREMLQELPAATGADDDEVLRFVSIHHLHGVGVGYLDAHLLVAARLTQGARLWTRDKRLGAVADRLSLSAKLHH